MGDDKLAWRRWALAVRNGLTEQQIADGSEAITRQVLAMPLVREAVSVLVYASAGSEVRTYTLMGDLLAAGKQVAVPVIESTADQPGVMHGYRIASLHHLAPDRYGILAPLPDRRKATHRLDDPAVVLVPALALDPETGVRLGRGGGYYDRYLSDRPGCEPVGLAFEEQLCGPGRGFEGSGQGGAGVLPCEPHDLPMRWIVTPRGVLLPRVSR
jgi:5-formyltetrahydrofolate cyclo-ligase